jgi:hypothetical protein
VSDNVVVQWDATALQGVRDSRIGPPMVARALAMAHTCMFDAWAAYDKKALGTRLGGDLRRPKTERTLANKNEAISFAAYRALVDLFPSDKASVFDPLMASLGYDPNNLTINTDTPAVAPFAMTSPDQFRSFVAQFGPALFGSETYLQQSSDLITISADLTDEQKMIAEYWANGPHTELPPGRWALFGEFVSRRDNHTVDDDAKMFFALTNAVFDAGIAAWDAKRAFDSVRPITSIPYLFHGQQIKAWRPFQETQTFDGSLWIPYQTTTFPTPPFPEYISGHSTFSAAGAEILKLFTHSDKFGDSVTFAQGSSNTEPGLTPKHELTLSWATFTDAANQAGISRRYGGIHFEIADLRPNQRSRLRLFPRCLPCLGGRLHLKCAPS